MNEFMTCDEIRDLLSPYFDAELSDSKKELVEKHLENCYECRQELEKIRQMSSLIKRAYQGDTENNPDNLVSTGLIPEKMQICIKTKTNLSAFIDGELNKEDTIELLEHIINCQFCRKQYEKIKHTQNITRNYLKNSAKINDYQIQPNKYTAILRELRQRKTHRKLLSSAAAVVFVAVLSWFSVSQFNTPDSTDSHIDKAKYIKTDKPMYVQSEEFILSELDSSPSEEVVSLIYGY